MSGAWVFIVCLWWVQITEIFPFLQPHYNFLFPKWKGKKSRGGSGSSKRDDCCIKRQASRKALKRPAHYIQLNVSIVIAQVMNKKRERKREREVVRDRIFQGRVALIFLPILPSSWPFPQWQLSRQRRGHLHWWRTQIHDKESTSRQKKIDLVLPRFHFPEGRLIPWTLIRMPFWLARCLFLPSQFARLLPRHLHKALVSFLRTFVVVY